MRRLFEKKKSYDNEEKGFKMVVEAPKTDKDCIRIARSIEMGIPVMVNLEKLKDDKRYVAEMHFKGLALFHNSYVMRVTDNIFGVFPQDMVKVKAEAKDEEEQMKEEAKNTAREFFQKIVDEKEQDENGYDHISDCVAELRRIVDESITMPFSEMVAVNSSRLKEIVDKLENAQSQSSAVRNE